MCKLLDDNTWIERCKICKHLHNNLLQTSISCYKQAYLVLFSPGKAVNCLKGCSLNMVSSVSSLSLWSLNYRLSVTLVLGCAVIRNATKWQGIFKVVYMEFLENQRPILIHNPGYGKKIKNWYMRVTLKVFKNWSNTLL